jgi:hypothetical protein
VSERERYIFRKNSEIDEAITYHRKQIAELQERRKWIEIEYDLKHGLIKSEPVTTAKGTPNA